MKNRIVLICFLCLVSTCLVLGQSNDQPELFVTYKDGSIFKGDKVDEDETQISLALFGIADTILLDKEQISNLINLNQFVLLNNDRYHDKVGFKQAVGVHLGGNSFEHTFQIEYSKVQIFNRLALGFGVAYNGTQEEELYALSINDFAELFLYSKYFINDFRARVFLDAKVGAAIALGINDEADYTSGLLFQPGLGVEFASSSGYRWSLHARRLIQSTTDFSSPDGQKMSQYLLGRTMLGVAFNF